jgi:purine-binding chemotaxis protein CheW
MAISAAAMPLDAGRMLWLLTRTGSRLCALPLDSVVETLRLLPVEPIEPCPPFVLGVCLLRGAPTPVVDIGLLFGQRSGAPRRLVAVKTGSRRVALAVDEVLGLRSIPPGEMPPLLREAAGEVISAIATLDAELLLVLDATRIVLETGADDTVGNAS